MEVPVTKNNPLCVAVVGATGIVGQEFIEILETRTNIPISELRLFGTKSAGEAFSFRGKSVRVKELNERSFENCTVAFFSAGAEASLRWAPVAVKSGCYVIDNSSAFRMNKEISLVVPEVNPEMITKKFGPSIIANPNCSAIQLVVVLKPLQQAFGLKQVTMSTYQSVSGAGRGGIDELSRQTMSLLNAGEAGENVTFPHSIAFNNIPHIDTFDPKTGFTFEEIKIMQETQKILSQPDLDISVTAVRTPTFNGHSEAVWVELVKNVSRKDILEVLSLAEGLVIQDSPSDNIYPLNREASGHDDVYVGRNRQDLKNKNRWLFWIVADNVRKGAALNGIQIAEKLFELPAKM
jgi:aspartate-semialdehyde dehydrogenase